MSEPYRDDLATITLEALHSLADPVSVDDSRVDAELRELLPVIEMLDRVGARIGSAQSRQDAPPAERDATGLLGDFLIVRVIGRGGMGVVYEAVQKSLNRRVALKILPLSSADDPRKVKRFVVEAQAAACLQHPHIVPVYLVGSENGLHYYAMQFIEGRTLAELIAASWRGGEAAAAGADRSAASFLAPNRRPARPAGRPGSPLRSRTRNRPPRRQALQPADRRLGVALGQRFRARQDRRASGPDSLRRRSGYLALHEPRAGLWHPRRRRSPHRHLLAGGHALRAAHSSARLRGRRSPGAAPQDRSRGAAAAAAHRPGHPQRPRDDRAQGDGQGPCRTVRDGPRAGRRPGSVPREPHRSSPGRPARSTARPSGCGGTGRPWLPLFVVLLVAAMGLGGAALWRNGVLRRHNSELKSALERAEHNESATRRLWYDSQMRLAQQVLGSPGQVEFAQEVLEGLRPESPGARPPRLRVALPPAGVPPRRLGPHRPRDDRR